MPSRQALEAASKIVYEPWATDSDGDLRRQPTRTLADWPALRDAVAGAMDDFARSLTRE